ncbi:MAG: hypothetical protein JWP91_2210 [Fibrobacteres bacterium]|nr:hypothetical protein [Fibrobacterota bacterium]
MSKRIWIWSILIPALSVIHAEDLDGLNEAVGVNQTLEEGFGARQSGMAVTFPAFQRDADAVTNAPASMNDVDDFTFSSAHAEKFGTAKFDDFAFLFPFESNSTLGLGLSRYGVSGIENWPEGSNPLASQPPEVFSIADYLLVGAFSRRWGGFDAGVNMNLLYRHLDQDGIGMRGDGMAQYTWAKRFRVSALMKGLIPSSASWQSGYSEYEAPELYLGGAARLPAPYFYGTLEAAWQSEGIFHRTAKSGNGLNGSRPWDRPGDFLAAGNLGLEFLFDFGMALRFGVNEFSSKSTASLATFGMGYNWRHILGLDYSFTPHPDLLATHRVSLQFTPAFPKFNGRDFRYRGSPRPLPALPETGTPASGVNPDPKDAVGSPDAPESLEPENGSGVNEAKPSASPSPKAQAPSTGKQASPPAQDGSHGGEKEVIEEEEAE